MNTNNEATSVNPLTDPNTRDVGTLLLRAYLKSRAAWEAENEKLTETTTPLIPEHFGNSGEMAEHQALTPGTPPESGRNSAGISPEYSAHSAGTVPPDGTSQVATHPLPARKRLPNESPLDDLPSETQAEILYLLDRYKLDRVTHHVTSAPPNGMGIVTSRSSLYRFHQRHSARRTTRRRQEDAAATAQLIAEAKTPGDISTTASQLIALRLVETASEENSDPSHLLALSKAIDRLQAIQLAERRLRLAEQKAHAR